MFTEIIVKHCAPTLVGIKVANLFSYTYDHKKNLLYNVEEGNEFLNSKGIFLKIMRAKNNTAQILIYRKNALQETLFKKENQRFLTKYGYNEFSIKVCLGVLAKHLHEKDFPHEIGVFLGYPLHDIEAFISNGGENFKIVGSWKVYENVEEAQKTFENFRKCTNIYYKKWKQGFGINQLAIAG